MRLPQFLLAASSLLIGGLARSAAAEEPAYSAFEQVAQAINESQQTADGHKLLLDNGRSVTVRLPAETFNLSYATKSAREVWYYTEPPANTAQLIAFEKIDLTHAYHVLALPVQGEEVGRIRVFLDYHPVATHLANGAPVRAPSDPQVDFLYLASDEAAKATLYANLVKAIALVGGKAAAPVSTAPPALAPPPSVASSATVDRIEILQSGVWDKTTKQFQPSASIPAKLGTIFGLGYIVRGPVAGAKIPLKVIMRSPSASDTANAEIAVDNSCAALFSFDKLEEIVPGAWTFEFWYADRKLAEHSFTVGAVPAASAPTATAVDRIEILEAGVWNKTTKQFQTGAISAELGTAFGFRYVAHGPVAGAQFPIKLIVRSPSAKVSAQPPSEGQSVVDRSRVIVFSFDSPEELAPGDWALELWTGDRKLAEQSFAVGAAAAKATPPPKAAPPKEPFEGVMTVETIALKEPNSTQQWTIKGLRWLIETPSNGNINISNYEKNEMVVHNRNGTLRVPIAKPDPNSPAIPAGRTEMVLGYRCEVYVREDRSGSTEMWVTDALGPVLGGTSSANISGMFPLRTIVRNDRGMVIFSTMVTSIERQPVSDAAFGKYKY
jgi:hypothetical protein